jgi:hypothetical protein
VDEGGRVGWTREEGLGGQLSRFGWTRKAEERATTTDSRRKRGEDEWTVLREGFMRRISGKDLRKGGKSRRKLNFPKMLIKITPKELPFSQTNGGISI